MIKRVYGHVEGVEVVFTPSADNQWKCIVPKTLDGEYVMDLYAEDYAGNVSYTATILFEVDAKHLLFNIKVLKYSNSVNLERYKISPMMRDFSINVLRCEVCGGDIYGNG